MKLRKLSISMLLLLVLVGCERKEPPTPYVYNSNPTFSMGNALFYGKYYDNYNTPNNVVELNLFTKKLKMINKKPQGTGHYLVLPDIFIPPTDTLMPTGKYVVSETRDAFTFLPGKKFVDTRQTIHSGAYVYFLEPDPSQSKIAYVTSGEFDVIAINDSLYDIKVNFILDKKDKFTATFRNTLYHLDETAKNQRKNKK